MVANRASPYFRGNEGKEPMTLSLHNTLTRKYEPFTPLNPENIGMYVCGPTVYDHAHLGNARAMVVFDVLYRMLKHLYPNVTYVRNITDVDDKINAAAKANGEPIAALTKRTTEAFHHDMAALKLLTPTHEPRATEHIGDMVAMIERLILQQHAYAAEGHVLFHVKHYAAYGKLSRRSLEEMIEGARVEVAPYKKNPGDFVLWKPSKEDEPGWDSPWGRGRPGWHIECSAMSTRYLGVNFDIHGGGADLQFPHHENEIAQSCCAYQGSHYASYWVHNGFLTVNGEKMSKSLGNFITVHDLLEKGVKGETIRYALLATHYSKPLDWNDKGLEDAKKALDSFYNALAHAGPHEFADNEGLFVTQAAKEVHDALCDDLNTPKALACLHLLAKDIHKATDPYERSRLGGLLQQSGLLLGLLSEQPNVWLGKSHGDVELVARIEAQIHARNLARQAKNWAESDRIRDALAQEGIVLEDKPGGVTEWRREQ